MARSTAARSYRLAANSVLASQKNSQHCIQQEKGHRSTVLERRPYFYFLLNVSQMSWNVSSSISM